MPNEQNIILSAMSEIDKLGKLSPEDRKRLKKQAREQLGQTKELDKNLASQMTPEQRKGFTGFEQMFKEKQGPSPQRLAQLQEIKRQERIMSDLQKNTLYGGAINTQPGAGVLPMHTTKDFFAPAGQAGVHNPVGLDWKRLRPESRKYLLSQPGVRDYLVKRFQEMERIKREQKVMGNSQGSVRQ